MKVRAEWDEQYPALFLHFPDEGDTEDRAFTERVGKDVPDELAARWRKVRDDGRALDTEVRKYMGVPE